MNYILCPGQGAQHVGMGKDFSDASSAARKIFDQANEVIGFDLAAIAFDGPAERLNQTDVSQPAIYVTSLAVHAAAVELGKVQPRQAGNDASEARSDNASTVNASSVNASADALSNQGTTSGTGSATTYAGLSLGEYTALHLAGVFDFESGLRLVAARGRLMQQAAEASPGSMVAVMGADEAAVDDLCAGSAGGEVLVPANYNAPGQIVVSGTRSACDRFTAAATAAGFRAVPLVVAGAFHSPLMQSAADAMAAELEKVTFHPPAAPVFSNVTAALHESPAAIKKLLIDQIVRPVRWEQTMAKIANDPDARFVELAPGKVLTGLLKKQNRRADVATLNVLQTLHGD